MGDKYEDNGCELHPHCLTCPEPRCPLDFGIDPDVVARNRKILEGSDKGKTDKELAAELKISVRTVRMIRTNRP